MNGAEAARQYLREVRTLLPMRFREKRQVLKRLALRVEEYTYANPAVGYLKLQDLFGAPAEVAASYVDSWSADELVGALNLRRRILRVVVSALLAFLVIVGVVGGYVAYQIHNYTGGNIIVTIGKDEQPGMGMNDPILDLSEIMR